MAWANPSPAEPALLIAGVAEASPLGRRIAAALERMAHPRFGHAALPPERAWRRTVAGTPLQWWDAAAAAALTESEACLWVDLHGAARPASDGPPGERWWAVVDEAGIPLLRAMHALSACHREPFTASLFLVEHDPPHDAQILAEAHLSSAVDYRTLLGALGEAAARLLRQGLRSQALHPKPLGRIWAAASPRPLPRPWPLARARLAARAHWLRGRLGGDLYGIALLDQAPETCLRDAVVSPQRWRRIDPAQGFIADPFFWPGRPGVVLCEAYAHRTGYGRLASFRIDTPDDPPDLREIMAPRHHLSYPFAWQEADCVLCLPEMAAARRQVLYAIKDGSVAPVCTIAEDVAMADPTIIHEGGRYWLMYSDVDLGAYDNLCLMFAERLEGPWTRHPGNPVKVDVRSSRPGGAPFRVAGRLFRPSQDCSRTYGGALAINRVIECTPERYREEVIAVLRPDPAGDYPDGVHTLSMGCGGLLIDGKRIAYHPAILWSKLRRHLLKIACGRRNIA